MKEGILEVVQEMKILHYFDEINDTIIFSYRFHPKIDLKKRVMVITK
jgi:hypothetical protein